MNLEGHVVTESEPKAETYLGAAILNGPGGAPDTPERYQPKPPTGVPTEFSVPLVACSPQEARAKQVLWHCLSDRIDELKSEEPCPCYVEQQRAAVRYLEALRERITSVVILSLPPHITD